MNEVNEPLGGADERSELARLRAEIEASRRRQKVLFDLTREIGLATTDGEVIHLFAEALHQLFPGRCFCLRVVDPETLMSQKSHHSCEDLPDNIVALDCMTRILQ